MLMRIIAIASTLLLPLSSMAQDADSKWSGRVTTYGWLTGAQMDTTISGTRAGTVSAKQTASLADILDVIDFAFFANAEVRYGRFGFIGDLVYTKLSADNTNARGVRVDTDLKTVIGLGAVAWRAWEDDAAYFDVLGGVRVLATEIDLRRQGILATQRASASSTLVDPVIGLRVGYAATDRLALAASADIGGFGIGTELSWEIFGGLSYAVTDQFTADLGFRYLSIDIEDGSLNTRLQLYGPVIGASYRF